MEFWTGLATILTLTAVLGPVGFGGGGELGLLAPLFIPFAFRGTPGLRPGISCTSAYALLMTRYGSSVVWADRGFYKHGAPLELATSAPFHG